MNIASNMVKIVREIRAGNKDWFMPKLPVGLHQQRGKVPVNEPEVTEFEQATMRKLRTRPNGSRFSLEEEVASKDTLTHAFENLHLSDRREKKAQEPTSNLLTEWKKAIARFEEIVGKKAIQEVTVAVEFEAFSQGVAKVTVNAITGHMPADVSEEVSLRLKENLKFLKRELDRVSFPVP